MSEEMIKIDVRNSSSRHPIYTFSGLVSRTLYHLAAKASGSVDVNAIIVIAAAYGVSEVCGADTLVRVLVKLARDQFKKGGAE